MKRILDTLKRIGKRVSIIALLMLVNVQVCLAATDVNASITKLSTLIASIVSGVGGVVLLFGAVQLGLGIQKHDPASKNEGVLAIVGGLVIAGAPWVIKQIM